MSVAIRCSRLYDKESLKAIIQSGGCCPPEDPQCPPVDGSPFGKSSEMNNKSCCFSSRLSSRCSPQPSCPPCPPYPVICPPNTGYARITCAPMPKSVPDSNNSTGIVLRTPMVLGGFFYTGTSRIYPLKPSCPPKSCFHSGSIF